VNRLLGFGRSRAGRFGLAAGVVVAVLVGLTAPAYAHHAIVSGSTYCANEDHVITWSIGNSESTRAMTIVSASASLNGQSYAVTGYTNPVPNSGTTQATTVVPGSVSQGTITLTVNVSWPDRVTWTGTAQVPLQGPCGCDCTTTSSSTSTTQPTTTTTEPTTTTTTQQCGCSTTTTQATTTTTEPTTTSTEATTTSTEATTTTTYQCGECTTTSTEATTTTTEPTTTSTQALGSTTIVTTTTLGHQGSTTPTTAKSTTTAAAPPVQGELPFTGSGMTIPAIFGIGSLLLGGALAFRKRGAWTK
jgi:LPXTG-motif cell wall-anchored protein